MISRSIGFLRNFERDLWILALGWFVGAMGFAASIPFIAIYFSDQLGMSPTQIGLFFGGMAVVRSLFQAIGGELSDHIGRRGLLIHSQWIRAVTFVFMGLSVANHWGFWMIAFWLLINSIFGAIFMPSVNAMVSDILPAAKRLDGYAVTRAAGNLGWAAGPAMGGFLVASSYASLFYVSSVITLISSIVFVLWLKSPGKSGAVGRFKFSDLADIGRDHNLGIHSFLIFFLYLVVAQMIMPFSLYTVDMVGISESDLGFLYTVNGLLVGLIQIPITRLFGNWSFTKQLSLGALLYFIGYGSLGMYAQLPWFYMVICVVTMGEVIMSPPSLTLTSRLAPEGRNGRYMGIYGFFVTAGWSFGPLLGGSMLDHFGQQPAIAWVTIASLALVASVGYLWFGRRLPQEYNRAEGATVTSK